MPPHQQDTRISSDVLALTPLPEQLLQEEASLLLTDIKTSLTECLQAASFRPGMVYWTKQLSNYLDLKYPLSRQDRARLASMYYELTIAPDMDPTLMELWANTCTRLIKKERLLAPEDLTLPWRPLFELIDRALFVPGRAESPARKQIAAIPRLLEVCSRFFDEQATQEILDTVLPRLNSYNGTNALVYVGLLGILLPTQPRHDPSKGAPSFDYLPTLFNLAQRFVKLPVLDTLHTDLWSRIAANQIGNVQWTTAQVKWVFTSALVSFDVPVGNASAVKQASLGARAVQTSAAGAMHILYGKRHGSERTRVLARWMVHSIYDVPHISSDSGDPNHDTATSTLAMLANLIQALEPFFHPSNSGTWAPALCLFLRHLAEEFWLRVRSEQDQDRDVVQDSVCPPRRTPQAFRLTAAHKHKFVKTLRTVALIAMFGKTPLTVSSTHVALKYLALIEPSLVMPELLSRAYPALETLTETHRTLSSISVLSAVGYPLVNRSVYANGARHVAALLHLTIPGIDLNDANKTFATLMFLSNIIGSIPIYDLTGRAGRGTSAPLSIADMTEWMSSAELEADQSTAMPMDVDATEEDDIVRTTTADFEDWVVKFLGRVFAMLENMSGQELQTSQDAETNLVFTLMYVCWTLFLQLSPELFDLALKQVVRWVSSSVVPSALKQVGRLAAAITSGNEAKAFPALFNVCFERIQDELQHGAASKPTLTSQSQITSDASLYWFQVILSEICRTGARELVHVQDRLVRLLDSMFAQCQDRKAFKYSAKALRFALMSLTSVYPADYRSDNPSTVADPSYGLHQVKNWGHRMTPMQTEVVWHIPNADEKRLAWQLVQRYAQPTLAEIDAFLAAASSSDNAVDTKNLTDFTTRHYLLKKLTLLNNILVSISAWAIDSNTAAAPAKTDVDDGHVSVARSCDLERKPHVLNTMSCFVDDPQISKDVKQLRLDISHACCNLVRLFHSRQVDDVEVLPLIIKMMRTALSDRGIHRSKYSQERKQYTFAKTVCKLQADSKAFPRALQVRKAHVMFMQRLRHNCVSAPTETIHAQLIDHLFDLSLNQFPAIRDTAQSALDASEMEEHELEGALQLVRTRTFESLCLRNPIHLSRLLMTLCKPPASEKATVLALHSKLQGSVLSSLTSASPIPATPQALSAFALYEPINQDRVSELRVKAQQKEQDKATGLVQLLQRLCQIVNAPDSHWRYAAAAALALHALISRHVVITADIAATIVKLCMSDIPVLRDQGIQIFTKTTFLLKQRSPVPSPAKIVISSKDLPADWPTQMGGDATPLVDKTYVGSFVLGDEVGAYRPGEARFSPHADDQAAYDRLRAWALEEDAVSHLVKYMSVEQSVGMVQNERINRARCLFFKSIFKTFGAEPARLWTPHIERLVQDSESLSSQRTAAEMMIGLLRGAKGWSAQDAQQLWMWAIAQFETAVSGITAETLSYWEEVVKSVCVDRDPRRFKPLVDYLLDIDIQHEAAFAEARKLHLARTLLVICSWRIQSRVRALLQLAIDNIEHPYKLVRDNIGNLINLCLQLLSPTPRWLTARECLRDNAQAFARGDSLAPPHRHPETEQAVTALVQKLQEFRADHRPAAEGASDYSNACWTVTTTLVSATLLYEPQGLYPIVVQLLPEVFAMLELDDQDLAKTAGVVILLLARFSYSPELVPLILERLGSIMSNGRSWHARLRALPALQLFFYHHIFLMSDQQMQSVVDSTLRTLLDSQVEIRAQGAVTLSGLVRCSRRDAIKALTEHALGLIAAPLPKRAREQQSQSTEYSAAMRQRHAGVLALSALVAAFPYEVPKWMPEVLVKLADHISDPVPIQTTVKQTFSDFKRTHQDTWHLDSQRFTEDQLSLLMDVLVSPSYYA
ncbi:Proteasome activator BLM10 [Sorochytrium milnesiophthora]